MSLCLNCISLFVLFIRRMTHQIAINVVFNIGFRLVTNGISNFVVNLVNIHYSFLLPLTLRKVVLLYNVSLVIPRRTAIKFSFTTRDFLHHLAKSYPFSHKRIVSTKTNMSGLYQCLHIVCSTFCNTMLYWKKRQGKLYNEILILLNAFKKPTLDCSYNIRLSNSSS